MKNIPQYAQVPLESPDKQMTMERQSETFEFVEEAVEMDMHQQHKVEEEVIQEVEKNDAAYAVVKQLVDV